MFSDNQFKAIKSIGNVAVLASAGSGKTTVFTERLKKELNDGTNANSILALTFTDKASKEFKKRIGTDLVYMGTFHSVFFKLIKTHHKNFSEHKIHSENSYKLYLENNLNDFTTDKEFLIKVENTFNLNKFIDNNINLILQCNSKNDYILKLKEKLEKDLFLVDNKDFIETFFKRKMKDKVMSFNDILVETYFGIKEDNNFFNILNNKKLIMVDEFQDNNKIVNIILKMISNNNLFLVGDVYQSIYSFNNSSFKNTLDLIKGMNIVQLDTNYRSSENIVNFSNKFIDKVLIEKSDKIKTIRAFGKKKNNSIKIAEYINDFTLPKIIRDSNQNLEDIAILARTNNDLVEIKSILDRYNIPFNEKNYNEFENLLNSLVLNILRDYKFEDKYFNRFEFDLDYKINSGIELIEVLHSVIKSYSLMSYFDSRGYEKLSDMIEHYSYSLINMYHSKEFKIALDSMENVLNIFLQKREYIEKTGVNVMTIHKSKGLEWNSVILYNFEDGAFPRNNSIEEEKRVYYVAITRAIENLYITSKKAVNNYTREILSDYCDKLTVDKNKKFNLEYDLSYKDDFRFSNNVAITFKNFASYKPLYADRSLKKYLDDSNRVIQKHILNNLNNISNEDIEIMLYELEDFIDDNSINNRDLKEAVEKVYRDKDMFFKNGVVDMSFINENFSEELHQIINFKNWVSEYSLEDEKAIAKLKSIVKNVISKKHTDITKDKTKKLLEIEQRHINNKLRVSQLTSYDDFLVNIHQKYYYKSNQEKEFFVNTMFNMKNKKTGLSITDFGDIKNEGIVRDIWADCKYNTENEKWEFDGETLAGNFLNGRKEQLANKRLAKIRYIEESSKHLRSYFITFTLPTEWHRWKMTNEAKVDKAIRVYEDFSILEENKNFILKGHNFEEHIIKSAQQINKVWKYFYKTLKKHLNNLKVKNKKLVKQAKMSKKEFKSFQYDYTNHFKVIEPHKNMTAHGHVLFFIDEKLRYLVNNVFNLTITKFSLNKKFQDMSMINKNKDTELGRLYEKKKVLERQIKLLDNNSYIKIINEKRAEIKSYNDLYKDGSIFELSKRKSKRLLKNELKSLLKKHREIYVKLNKLKKELEIADIDYNEFNNIHGAELLRLEETLKNYEGEELELIEAKISKLKSQLKHNFASATTYIFKYQMKNMQKDSSKNGEDEEVRIDNIIFFNAWESLIGNKAKLISISNYKDITQNEIDKIYKYHKDNFPHELERIKESDTPLYIHLEKLKIDGSFIFSYSSRLKESFNNASFLKDIEDVYISLLKDNKDKSINMFLYSVARNMVINHSKDKYLNFLTHKKLIEANVSKDYIDSVKLEVEEYLTIYSNEELAKPQNSFLDEMQRIELFYDRIYKYPVEVNGMSYRNIYHEDMYIQGDLTLTDIFDGAEFAISNEYLNGLLNNPNHKDNIAKDMLTKFRTNDITEILTLNKEETKNSSLEVEMIDENKINDTDKTKKSYPPIPIIDAKTMAEFQNIF